MEHLLEVHKIGKHYSFSSSDYKLKDLLEVTLKSSLGIGTKRPMEDFWALRDVSFAVQPGEVLGVIGRNGSGKSTLLRLIARLTHLSEGEMTVRGSIGSYLGIGAGIHPELTGRENVALSATILGMPKRELGAKMEEITEFAELGAFIDVPVKFYSSGMQARLAFAVASHLDRGDILLIDEALATGDQAFCAKCIVKLKDIVKSGQTILFASHGMGQVHDLATQCLYLREGRIAGYGKTDDVIAQYQRDTMPAGATA